MMTAKQISLYWRTWSAVCAEFAWRNSDSDRRYALHAQAECPQSMRDFDNSDLDRYLSVARRLLGSRECHIAKSQDGERKRLLWRIRRDARLARLDAAYLSRLSEDLYGLACWEELAIDDLAKFRNTIHTRAGSHLGRDTRSYAERHPPVVDPDLIPF